MQRNSKPMIDLQQGVKHAELQKLTRSLSLTLADPKPLNAKQVSKEDSPGCSPIQKPNASRIAPAAPQSKRVDRPDLQMLDLCKDLSIQPLGRLHNNTTSAEGPSIMKNTVNQKENPQTVTNLQTPGSAQSITSPLLLPLDKGNCSTCCNQAAALGG